MSVKNIDRDALKRAAVELRKQGKSWTTIGKALKVSSSTAARLVEEALRDLASDSITSTIELRELALARLNEARQHIFEMMTPDNPPDVRLKASAEWRAINEQEAKLLGLNSPELFSLQLPMSLAKQLEKMGLTGEDLLAELTAILSPAEAAAATMEVDDDEA